jgi:competence protein ComGC
MSRRGFTLIELLIFIAVFSAVIIGFVTMLIAVIRVQSRQSSSSEVGTQAQFLLQQIEYYVTSARLVDMTQDSATSTLKLRESVASSTLDPTFITLASGTVYLQQGVGSALQALTSNKVVVTGLTFTRHYNLNNSSTPYGTDSVSYSFTMAANNTNQTQYYSQFFQSSVAVLAPVPKIALLQQASVTNNGSNITSVTSTFSTNNTTGSLLVAVVADTGGLATTITVTDSAGNTWINAANPNVRNEIYYAANVKNSSDTITASFNSSGGTAPSLFIYEYRGASTSSPLDASSSLTTPSTANPSSSSTTPTSSPELIFGLLTITSAGSITPGSGFTTEASSSVTQAYIEDQPLYVTGPVMATWSYSASSPPTTSAVATVLTFK